MLWTIPRSNCLFEGEDAVVSFAIRSGLIKMDENSDGSGSVDEQHDGSSEQLAGDGASRTAEGEGDGPPRSEDASERRGDDRVEAARDMEGGVAVRQEDAATEQLERDEQPGGDPVGEQRDSGREQAVSASQIDCSVTLSAPTLDSIFDRCHPVDDLSQNAVGRAFDLVASLPVLDESDHGVVIGAFQRLLSEAESDTRIEEEGKCEEDDPPHAAASVPKCSVDNVNIMKDGEDAAAYENLDSSGSDEEDELDDEVVVPREYPDDHDLSDDEAELVDEAFLESLGGSLDMNNIDKDALRQTEWGAPSSAFETDPASYPQLSRDVAAPIPELREIADSPLALFLYFLPKTLWVQITDETNRYRRQHIEARASRMRANQVRSQRPSTPETLAQLRRRLRAEKPYDPSEILHVIGLLVAHALCPHKRRFSSHWSMTDDGAVSAGIFGRFMARNRCTSILRDLHFVNNEAPQACDRLWKLRPVVDVLTERFRSGWSLPAVFSFDEGVLPATSRRNTTRMFMPDKPHRYGTKMFMVCDSKTAYCHRYVFAVNLSRNLRHLGHISCSNVVTCAVALKCI